MSKKTSEKKFYYRASVATHPLLLTLVFLLFLYAFPVSASGLYRSAELAAGIALFVALPFSLLYRAVKKGETTINLEDREKRNKFFLPWAAIFALAFLFYSYFASKPHAALALSFCGAMLLLFYANRKSKISWHATGLSVILASSAYHYGAVAAFAFLAVLALACFARWKLGAHTPFQLAAGALSGAAIAVASLSLAY